MRATALGSFGFLLLGLVLDVNGQAAPTFTPTQEQLGRSIYLQSCQSCHGEGLRGGEFAPPLRGATFRRKWAGQSIGRLLEVVQTTMPPGNAGKLRREAYVHLIAHILAMNGAKPGPEPMPSEISLLEAMKLPQPGVIELTPTVPLPPWPRGASATNRMSAVSDAVLRQPPEGSWPSWRRTQVAAGFSPLMQITRSNVKSLQVSWALALPPGPNQSTPLVHDGVIFVYSYGDHIQALDAATGEEYWRYSHHLPNGKSATVHRNIALYENSVYIATSDAHLIALDSRTGKLVWDRSVGDELSLATGGPLVGGGVVMLGLTGATKPGGSSIVGLDAATGAEQWRFKTIAQPGEPFGNSWNGLPMEKRTGGSVWTAGSFDAVRNLALFGVAPTYDTEPLRHTTRQPGHSNEALYTNSTVALDPKTGRLRWFYQHMPNDQWDLDWAFERHVIDLQIGDATRSVVMTAGKGAIYDAVDAVSGKYVFSIDLGLQNVIKGIDARTGKKNIDRTLTPGDGKTITVCPHTTGAKSWQPGSYNSLSHLLVVPLVESCMDLMPVPEGDPGLLSTGVWPSLRPTAGSDGKYGRLQAIDLKTRQTVWSMRQRSPFTSGTVLTQTGLVFVGSLDRHFSAFDADSGKQLWTVRLSDTPSSSPITYTASGKQYVAVVVSTGSINSQAAAFAPFTPEVRAPIGPSASLWVFALPD